MGAADEVPPLHLLQEPRGQLRLARLAGILLQDASPAVFLEADLLDKEKGERKKEKGNLDEATLFPFSFELFTSGGWEPPDYSPERRLHDEWDLLGFVLGPPLMALFRPQLPSGLITSPEI